MKICFLADGGSIHTQRWCKHFVSKGYNVHLISFKDIKIEGVHVHFLNAGNIASSGGNWKVLLAVPLIKKILKEIKPDIVHSQYATSYGAVGALTGFKPYVVTTLGSDVLISPNQSVVYKAIVKYVFRKADWITAMAEHMKTAVLKLGVPAKKVSTVMFGIDPTIFNHRTRLIDKNKFVITSTRNFEPIYNQPLFLKALAIIKDQIPNLRVNMIGDGSQREFLVSMIKELQLDSLVKLHGKLPQVKIAEFLNQSNLFISVSLSDGNNVSLNEAMACGAVSVVTDIPANRQWINEGVNGFLVPTEDPSILAQKILEVYQNYSAIQSTAIEYNDKIIAEKALWSDNMAIVENKYLELIEK